MEIFRAWMTQIISFIIFIVLFGIIVPNGKMRKYINLVSGFILIIIILNPILKFLNSNTSIDAFALSNESVITRNELLYSKESIEEEKKEQLILTYRSILKDRLLEAVNRYEGIRGENVDIIINEDYNSEKFGEIKRVYLTICKENEKTRIEEINIRVPAINNKNERDMTIKKEESKIVTELKNEINNDFLINKENILITFVGEE